MCAVFVVLISFFPGSDLIARHMGVAAAQTPRRALLLHALGPIRALVIGPDSAAVHSWNWRPLKNQLTTPPAKWLYLTNIIKTKARSSKRRKKKTEPKLHQLFKHFTMGDAFGRRTGIRR